MAFQRAATQLRVYVGGIGVGATEPDLYAAFARVGVQLTHVELVVNRATGCLRGFAFVAIVVAMADDSPAVANGNSEEVLARMRMALVDGRPLTVQAIARELTLRPSHRPMPVEEVGGTPPALGHDEFGDDPDTNPTMYRPLR